MPSSAICWKKALFLLYWLFPCHYVPTHFLLHNGLWYLPFTCVKLTFPKFPFRLDTHNNIHVHNFRSHTTAQSSLSIADNVSDCDKKNHLLQRNVKGPRVKCFVRNCRLVMNNLLIKIIIEHYFVCAGTN